ncbi:hypothetical protein DN545_35815, partial [Burkholderia multivorans]
MLLGSLAFLLLGQCVADHLVEEHLGSLIAQAWHRFRINPGIGHHDSTHLPGRDLNQCLSIVGVGFGFFNVHLVLLFLLFLPPFLFLSCCSFSSSAKTLECTSA